jgi:hypothetical protein
MLFADLSLAQRLEKQDALLNVWYAEALERLKPESLPAIAHIADGTVVYVGNESPLSRAVGFGMNGEVTDVDFDALEDFYRSRNSSVQIDLCPLAHPSLMRLLGERGYQFAEFINFWYLPLSGYELPQAVSGIDVHIVNREEGQIWAETLTRGFNTLDEHAALETDFPIPFLSMPNNYCFLARIDGEATGAGMMAIQDGVAILFGTSTLPSMRNRGAQSALLRERLNFALESKCELAMVGTTPGSNSQRNVERLGFRLAYTKAQMIRRWQ